MSKNKADSALSFDQTPGPLVDGYQEEWWLEGKTRIKKEKTFIQTKQGKVLAGLVVIILAVTFWAVLNRQTADTAPAMDESVLEEPESIEQSPLHEQIKRVRSQLDKADPANKDTSLPQLETNITIDE